MNAATTPMETAAITRSPEQSLARVLACPACHRAPLARTDTGWRCEPCRVTFPELDGVPCLYREPAIALGDWRGRCHALLRRLQQEAREFDAALEAGPPLELTRRRLDLLRGAKRAYHDELRTLLAPLIEGHAAAGEETYRALGTSLPTDLGLTSYAANVHRDWCWGHRENSRSARLVIEALGDQPPPRRMLVLGAGAGRLAQDLHAELGCEITATLELNPLLALIAARMARGESVDLHEFPIAPRTLADTALARRLRAPQAARPGLVPLLGDVLSAPFADGGFDVVLTPWVIDVLPEDPARLAARVNRLLAPGGRWIGFGSLAFGHADPAQRLSLEEFLATVSGLGFTEPRVRETEIPYLCCPASRHGRRERVMTFRAERTKPAPMPARHAGIPDWLTGARTAVPRLQAFDLQTLSTRVNGFVLGLVDGRRSVRDMALIMEAQRLMPRSEAEPAIRQLLQRLWEQSERDARY